MSRGFVIPVWILFLRSRGLSFTQIGLLEAIFFATITISEIPTGYVGDRLGRRNSLVLGSLCVAVSFVGFGFAHSFLAFVVPYLAWGVGDAFQSGSSDAWLYDMLTDRLDADAFTRIHGRGTTANLLTFTVTAVIGGALGTIDLYYPFVAASGLLVVNLLILLRLPKNPQYADTGNHKREIVPVSRTLSTIRLELTRSTLRSFVVYIALVYAVIGSVALFVQPISIDLGIYGSQIGVLYAGFRLFSAVGSYYTETIRTAVGIRGWLYTIPLVLGGLYIGAWFLPLVSLPAFFLMDMSVGVTRTVAAQYINDAIDSVNRATLLSATSMIYTAVQIPFVATAGMLADTATQFGAVAVLGGILIGGAAFIAVSDPPVTTERTEQLSD